MGTHPIFESDFDCLTDCDKAVRDHLIGYFFSPFLTLLNYYWETTQTILLFFYFCFIRLLLVENTKRATHTHSTKRLCCQKHTKSPLPFLRLIYYFCLLRALL